MLDKNIKITTNRYSSTTCVHPEKIDLNIKKIEEQSFFKEINRNTKSYEKLLQEILFYWKTIIIGFLKMNLLG